MSVLIWWFSFQWLGLNFWPLDKKHNKVFSWGKGGRETQFVARGFYDENSSPCSTETAGLFFLSCGHTQMPSGFLLSVPSRHALPLGRGGRLMWQHFPTACQDWCDLHQSGRWRKYCWDSVLWIFFLLFNFFISVMKLWIHAFLGGENGENLHSHNKMLICWAQVFDNLRFDLTLINTPFSWQVAECNKAGIDKKDQ